MALITPSGLISNIRGSIGGTTYQRSASGLIARTRTAGVQPRSPAQSSRRNLMARLQVNWLNLTENQRTAWGEWVNYQALTALRTSAAPLTGQQAFIQSSYYMVLLGYSPISSPVFTPYSITQLGAEVLIDAGALIVSINAEVGALQMRPVLMLSTPLRATRNSKPAYLRWMYVSNDGVATPCDISSQYLSTFGQLPLEDDHVWMDWFLLQTDNSALGPITSQRYTIGTP